MAQANAALQDAQRNGATQIADAADRVAVAEASVDASDTSGDVQTAIRRRDDAVAARNVAMASYAALTAASGPTVPLGEVVFAPFTPVRAQTLVSSVGQVDHGVQGDSGTSGSLLQLASGRLVVYSAVRSGDRNLVHASMIVQMLDEETNVSYPAVVTSVSPSATLGADGQLTYPLTVEPSAALPDELANKNLRLTLTAASTGSETLVVPLAAVSSEADGSSRVSVLRIGSLDPIDVAVTAGLSADGLVAVAPLVANELKEGDLVVVGR